MATDLLINDKLADSAASTVATELVHDEEFSRPPVLASAAEVAIDSAGSNHPSRSIREVLSDFVQLTKPRIVVMILVTTVSTAMIGAGGLVDWVTMFWLLIGTAAVAASAGAANQVWERAIDQLMPRTAVRPLPDGRLGILSSIVFTIVLGLAGTWLLVTKFGIAPALAATATWVLYVLVYTPMKTRTAWNTTVGAVAGALPMLIGYTATGGMASDLAAWLLVGVLVAWQYPHFMAIAWMYRRQYEQAGFCMTTTVDPSGRSAGMQSILGSLLLIGCGTTLCWITSGWIVASLASAGVVAACYPMLKASFGFNTNPNDATARRLLRSSLLVLPIVLLIVTLRVFW